MLSKQPSHRGSMHTRRVVSFVAMAYEIFSELQATRFQSRSLPCPRHHDRQHDGGLHQQCLICSVQRERAEYRVIQRVGGRNRYCHDWKGLLAEEHSLREHFRQNAFVDVPLFQFQASVNCCCRFGRSLDLEVFPIGRRVLLREATGAQ